MKLDLKKHSKYFLILLLPATIFYTQFTYAEFRCEKIYSTQDFKQLVISQEDPQFYKFDLLFKDQPSQLCGITSLANFINLRLEQTAQPMTRTDLIHFIAKQSQDFSMIQQKRGDRRFSVIGMYTHDLARMARYVFKKMGLNYSISDRNDLMYGKEVRPKDLMTSVGSIWTLRFVPNNPEADGADHFVLVLNYDSVTGKINFIDPLEPQILKSATVTLPKQNSENNLIQVNLNPGFKMEKLIGNEPGSFTITGVIKFTKK